MASNGSKKHNQMVEYVARHLKRRFYDDVRAHAEGFRPPARVNKDQGMEHLVPDVTMLAKGHHLHVLEVETRETLKRTGTTDKWQALARHAEARGGRFWVVVPRGASSTALNKLRALDVRAKVWEVEMEHV